MKFFSGVDTVEAVKKLYRALAMEFHPDRGGDTATMQEVNAEYHEALKRCSGQQRKLDDGKVWTYTYDYGKEQEVVEQIDKTLAAKVLTGAHEFTLIGRWLWIVGDTKPIKDSLKQLGYQWHSKRTAWYWKPSESHSRYNARYDLNGLAAIYGSATLSSKEDDKPRNATYALA